MSLIAAPRPKEPPSVKQLLTKAYKSVNIMKREITLCVNPSLAPGRSVHSEVKTVPSEETRRLRERAR
jgi:hypothetical protein